MFRSTTAFITKVFSGSQILKNTRDTAQQSAVFGASHVGCFWGAVGTYNMRSHSAFSLFSMGVVMGGVIGGFAGGVYGLAEGAQQACHLPTLLSPFGQVLETPLGAVIAGCVGGIASYGMVSLLPPEIDSNNRVILGAVCSEVAGTLFGNYISRSIKQLDNVVPKSMALQVACASSR